MADYDLTGGHNSVGLEPFNTVGVMGIDGVTDNQSRTTRFSPTRLVEWAEAVEDAYDTSVDIVFTPDAPMIATVKDHDDPSVGIAVAPRISASEAEADD